MFIRLGLNDDKYIHTLPLQSPHLLSLHLSFLPLETLRLVSLVSLITKTQYDRKRGIWQEYDRQRTLGKYMIDFFSEHSGLFRFVLKQFCLFRLFRYRFETPKQTKFFFGFTKQPETNAKQILFRFVSVRTEFFFFHFEDTLLVPFLLSFEYVVPRQIRGVFHRG